MKNQEIEIKYFIADLPALESRLVELGAPLAQPRTSEINLKFDLPGGEFTSSGRVIRLRQDEQARLTYKGPSGMDGGARVRTEIEFVVSDFDAARAFLEALGYRISVIYEKFRTTYDLDEVHVTLDELPYGTFAELEGPDSTRIAAVNQKLGLDWDAGVYGSYTQLFDDLRQRLDLPFRDLTFENFADLQITPQELGVRPADHL